MTQAAEVSRGESRSLWIGLFTSPIVYSLYFLSVYSLVEFGCRSDFLRFNILGLSAITVGVLVMTAVAALLTLYGSFVTYRHWRRYRQGEEREQEDDAVVISFVGMGLNGYFTVLILLTGLPALFSENCYWI